MEEEEELVSLCIVNAGDHFIVDRICELNTPGTNHYFIMERVPEPDTSEIRLILHNY